MAKILPSAVPDEWTTQLRRGVLELCVLNLLNQRPSHGYELIGRLASFGPLAAGENTVYPLLRRLKNEGALETQALKSPAGPPRQIYAVTALGRERLNAFAGQWKILAKTMEDVLDG